MREPIENLEGMDLDGSARGLPDGCAVQCGIFDDPRLNEHGVIDAESEGVVSISGPARRKAEFWGWKINACELPDGTWRAAASFMCGTHGFSGPLSPSSEPYTSRTAAVSAAARYIIGRLEKEKQDALVAASVKELRGFLEIYQPAPAPDTDFPEIETAQPSAERSEAVNPIPNPSPKALTP